MEATGYNMTIFLSQIPPDLNTVHNIKGHFNLFGEISKVQVAYNGDQRAASVEFCSLQAAYEAYQNKEPVLNVRCIKKSRHPIKPVRAPIFSPTKSDSKMTTVGFECHFCQQLLSSEASLRDHTKKKHVSVKCQFCGEICESKNVYRKHHNDFHNDKPTTSDESATGEPKVPQALNPQNVASGAESSHEPEPCSTSRLQPPITEPTETVTHEPSTPIAMAGPDSMSVSARSSLNSTPTESMNRNRDRNDSIPTKRHACGCVNQSKEIARLKHELDRCRDYIHNLKEENSKLTTGVKKITGRARELQRERDLHSRVHDDIVKRLEMKLAHTEETLSKMHPELVQEELERKDRLISEQKRELELREMQMHCLNQTLAVAERQCAGYYPQYQFNNGQCGRGKY